MRRGLSGNGAVRCCHRRKISLRCRGRLGSDAVNDNGTGCMQTKSARQRLIMKVLCRRIALPACVLLFGLLCSVPAWADSNEMRQMAPPSVSLPVTAQASKGGTDSAPDAVRPIPVDGATVATTLTLLDWGDIRGASSYEVFFGTNASLGQRELLGTASLSQWPLRFSLEPETAYYWRIVAKNRYGDTTGRVWRFTTMAVPPPAVPSSPLPADGQGSVSLSTVILDWADAKGAESYDVYFAAMPGLGREHFKGSFTVSSWRLDCELIPATQYYWRVVAKNAYGGTTGAVWRFTTQGAARPSLF